MAMLRKKITKPCHTEDGSEEVDISEMLIDSSESSDLYSLCSEEAISRRIIHLASELGNNTFEKVKNLYDAILEDTLIEGKLPETIPPIHVVCSTPGGDLASMLGIMNLLLYSEIPIYTYVMAQTSSAGAWVYLCGQKRFAPKNGLSCVMFHPSSWNGMGEREGHMSFQDFIRKIEKNLTILASERTTIPAKMLKDLSENRTYYFVGAELFKYHIATDVFSSSSFFLKN